MPSHGPSPDPMSLPRLSPALLPALRRRDNLLVPAPEALDLPERVVQFGTGALLRGFVEAFLEHANRQGAFGGRVVAVSQTGSGRSDALNAQGGLYTLRVEGLEDGRPVERTAVVAAVSRVLSARDDWDAVLALARRPEIGFVVSNTTEVGIQWDEEDDPSAAPPRSFPARLAAFLRARAEAFDFDVAAGVVVLPCELIEDNGDALRALVGRWAERGGFGARFTAWLDAACAFPNTLVDRIVPGAPSPERRAALEAHLGYTDPMLTTCEPYRLWAIEGDEALRARLPFAAADAGEPGIVVVPDVAPYRLRKVRILNGAHTLLAPVALACGLETVREAVLHETVGTYLRRVVCGELVPAVEAEPGVEAGSATTFARAVLERFANPFIRHELRAITLQHTMKLGVRVAPTVARYTARYGRPPQGIAFGFAAYFLMQRAAAGLDGDAFDHVVPLEDDHAEPVRAAWRIAPPGDVRAVVEPLLRRVDLWGQDLTAVPGFAEAVVLHLAHALADGLPAALDALLAMPAPATL